MTNSATPIEEKDYMQLDLGFAPIVMDSIGQMGASALRFFKRTADFTAKANNHSSTQTLKYCTAIYHRLRLQFLRAGFEAMAERLIHGPPSQMELADDHQQRLAIFISSMIGTHPEPLPGLLDNR